MRYQSLSDLEASNYSGLVYRVEVVLFDVARRTDGTEVITDSAFYEHGDDLHPYECLFTDREEARSYASCFDATMVRSALDDAEVLNCDGQRFANLSVEVIVLYPVPGRAHEWEPDCAVSTYDWMGGEALDIWHIEDERAMRAPNVLTPRAQMMAVPLEDGQDAEVIVDDVRLEFAETRPHVYRPLQGGMAFHSLDDASAMLRAQDARLQAVRGMSPDELAAHGLDAIDGAGYDKHYVDVSYRAKVLGEWVADKAHMRFDVGDGPSALDVRSEFEQHCRMAVPWLEGQRLRQIDGR